MAGEERDDHADLVAEMFALLTGRLEDAAGVAGESQAPLPISALRTNAEHLTRLIVEAAALLAKVRAMLREAGPGPDRGADYK